MVIFLALLILLPLVEGPVTVIGHLHSSKNLAISSRLPVKDITWRHILNSKETEVAKIKDDKVVSLLSNKYQTLNNGRNLTIHNLTINDRGRYIAHMTLLNDTMKKEDFHVTVRVQGQVTGDLHSSKNLTIPFDLCAKKIIWTHEVNGTETEVAKIKDGELIEHLTRHQTFDNRRVLTIHNLTTNDCGRYMANITLCDNTTIEVEFNLTDCEKNTGDRLIVVVVLISAFIVALSVVVVVVVLMKRQKRKGKYNDLELGLDENDEMIRCRNENEQNSNNEAHQMLIEMKEHINYEDETNVPLIPPRMDPSKYKDLELGLDENGEMIRCRNENEQNSSDLDGEIREVIVEVHQDEGHEDKRDDHEGHETEERECDRHGIEEDKNGGHENEEHLPTLVEESRDQTEVEEHENNEPEHEGVPVEGEKDGNNVNETENEENLTIPVQETGEQTAVEEPENNEPEYEEHLRIPVEESDNVRTLQKYLDDYVEKIEDLHDDDNTGGLLQDIINLDEEDKVEEHKTNDDYEKEDDQTLVEEKGDQKGEL